MMKRWWESSGRGYLWSAIVLSTLLIVGGTSWIVWAAIQEEVGQYVWDSTNTKWTKQRGSTTGSMIAIGASTPANNFTNPTTAMTSWALLGVYDGANWDMLSTIAASASEGAGGDIGSAPNVLGTAALTYVSSSGTGWRVLSGVSGTPSDNFVVGVTSTNIPVYSLLYGFDGTNWDRAEIDANGYLKVTLGTALSSTLDNVRADAQKAASGDDFQVSCTNTTGTFKATNASRVVIQWMNQSAVDVYMCYETPCTTAIGMRYREDMGFVEKNYTGAITCITASGTATVAGKEY